MSILLPLYVYPNNGAWEPLYAAAKAYPKTDFTVVVNPCSGPCRGSLPETVYQLEIPKLRTFPNIRTLGYVATNYTNRPIDEVIIDINTYASWSGTSNNTHMSVDGIFFDETPALYVAEKYEYLKNLSQKVKNEPKFKDRLVVHNPGNISFLEEQAKLPSYTALADISVIFEESFDRWVHRDIFDRLQDLPIRKNKLAVILHSVPDVSRTVMDWVVENLEASAEWIFVTSNSMTQGHYGNFSPLFDTLLKTVA